MAANAFRNAHLVLVPGFGGFDALGEMDYYPEATTLLAHWQDERPWEESNVSPVLHKFANYPTASVKCRASLLLEFLAKKIVNNEILSSEQYCESVTLLGHSTGGLDIRQLLYLCRIAPEAHVKLYGQGRTITRRDVRRVIRRIVYMSVPHFGTNIADFALSIRRSIQDVAGDAEGWLRKGQPLNGLVQELINRESPCEMIMALSDVLEETRVPPELAAGQRDLTDVEEDKVARKLRARSDVIAWLALIHADVKALSDLSAAQPYWDLNSELLQEEREDYKGMVKGEIINHPIKTLTFATYDDRRDQEPILNDARRAWPTAIIPARLQSIMPRVLLRIFENFIRSVMGFYDHMPDCLRRGLRLICLGPVVLLGLQVVERPPMLGPWRLYGLCHEITTGNAPDAVRQLAFTEYVRQRTRWGRKLKDKQIDESTNDGIVNTLSMLWPSEDPEDEVNDGRRNDSDRLHQVKFVRGDHADIIGHYLLRPFDDTEEMQASSGRRYISYDLLQSGLNYGADHGIAARRDWFRVFDFAYRP